MEKARVRSVARMVLYVAVACLLGALLLAVRVFNGDLDGVAGTGWAFILATVGLVLAVPAGYALAMAQGS